MPLFGDRKSGSDNLADGVPYARNLLDRGNFTNVDEDLKSVDGIVAMGNSDNDRVELAIIAAKMHLKLGNADGARARMRGVHPIMTSRIKSKLLSEAEEVWNAIIATGTTPAPSLNVRTTAPRAAGVPTPPVPMPGAPLPPTRSPAASSPTSAPPPGMPSLRGVAQQTGCASAVSARPATISTCAATARGVDTAPRHANAPWCAEPGRVITIAGSLVRRPGVAGASGTSAAAPAAHRRTATSGTGSRHRRTATSGTAPLAHRSAIRPALRQSVTAAKPFRSAARRATHQTTAGPASTPACAVESRSPRPSRNR